MHSRRSIVSILPYLVLVIAPAAAYWPLTLARKCMKYDTMDIAFPYRRLFSDFLAEGIFPYWNPFIQLGLPLVQDPGAALFYPPVALIALLTGYPVYGMHFEFLIHLFIAGLGMYLLLRFLGRDRALALTMAIAAQLAGCFLSHAQHIGWVDTMAWIPLLYYFVLSVWKRGRMRDAIGGAFVFLCFLTAGYPPIVIIQGYLLLALAPLLWWKWRQEARSHFAPIAVFAVLALGSAAIFGYSIADTLPYLNRGEGLSAERAMFGSFQPMGLWTFLFPFVNTSAIAPETGYFPSMQNVFIGTMSLAGVFLYMPGRRKTALENYFLIAGILCILISLGEALPLRHWIYHGLPMMDLFRYPAVFRVFAVFFLLIVASGGLQRRLRDTGSRGNLSRFRIPVIAAAVYAIVLFFALSRAHAAIIPGPFSAFPDKIASSWPAHAICFGLGLAALVAVHRWKGAKWLLFGSLLLEMVIFVSRNAPVQVYHDRAPADLQEVVDGYPEGFPIPDLDRKSLEWNRFSSEKIRPVMYHEVMFRRGFAHDGFYPLSVSGLRSFDRDPEKWKILEQPLVFVSRNLAGVPDTVGAVVGFQSFRPDQWQLRVQSPEDARLVILQNKYPKWKAYLNGRPAEISEAFHTVMAIRIPEGTHTVRLQYEDGRIHNLYRIHWLYAGFLLLLFLGSRFRIFRFKK